jgi:hypothetical protein
MATNGPLLAAADNLWLHSGQSVRRVLFLWRLHKTIAGNGHYISRFVCLSAWNRAISHLTDFYQISCFGFWLEPDETNFIWWYETAVIVFYN